MKRSLIEPTAEQLEAQVQLIASVAMRALALRRFEETERLISRVAESVRSLARYAAAPEEVAAVARMRRVLAPILRELEAATGKGWSRFFDVPPGGAWIASRSGQA